MKSTTFFWKICVSKLTETFSRDVVIGARRFFGITKSTNVNHLSRNFYTRPPRSALFIVKNSLESTGVIGMFFSIGGIVNVKAVSQVISLIIQTITVPMVCIQIVWSAHNKAMHKNHFAKRSFPFPSHSVAFSSLLFQGAPLPLIEPLKILVVNQCDLTLRKRDLFCHCYSKLIHPLNVQLSRLAHGARNNQRVQVNYKTKSVPYQSRHLNYITGVM